MLRKLPFLLLLLIVCRWGHAQAPTLPIHGTVQDSLNKQPLEDATVSLIRSSDASLLRRTRGRKEFIFAGLPAGNYTLVTSYLGYATDTTALILRGADTTGKRVRILLHH